MKNIGVFHYKVGGTDGVSLEIDKWKQVLEENYNNVLNGERLISLVF